MKILFLGLKRPSSIYLFLSLKKNYKKVDLIDGYKSFFLPYITHKIFYHIHPKILESTINQYILSKIKRSYDLIFVRSGQLIGKKLILELKKKTKKIVFYCSDNPFVSREKQKWKLCLPALKFYDLMIFPNKSRISLSKKYGIKKTLLVWPSYEKEVHTPQKMSLREQKKYSNDVISIATWFPERGAFFRKLIDRGLNLKIYGNDWYKDKNYKLFKHRVVLGHVGPSAYSKLIWCAKIALCLPSKGNVDDITRRSLEIPATGTLLCAIRTKSHKKAFVENKEAIFFKDEKECYKKCKNLLSNMKKIKKIAYRGHIKATKILKADNETIVKKIVHNVFNQK